MNSIILFLFAIISFGLFLLFLVWINIADHKRRAGMTPEERRIDDEERESEMWIW